LETDAPYLTPEPHRGKRNESSYIPIIAQRLADIKQIPLVEVMQKTTENALQLFEGGSK
jgi:TatD DNase family protein